MTAWRLNCFDLKTYYLALILLKIFFGTTIYIFSIYYLDYNFFIYPDFSNIYSNCSQDTANILYTRFICISSDILGVEKSPSSYPFIVLAALLNLFISIFVMHLSKDLISKKGLVVLILCLSLHPYLAIYFLRFYTDLFASLGVLLIAIYSIKSYKVDYKFIIFAVLLINFRSALIPVFLTFGIIKIFEKKLANIDFILVLSLILLNLIMLFYYLDYGSLFVGTQDVFQNSIFQNIIYTLGFRESHAGDGLLNLNMISTLGLKNFVFTMLLIIFHFFGILGVCKLGIQKNISILSIFAYVVPALLVISHLRYLMPLMPLLSLGFVFLFFNKKTKLVLDSNK